MIGRVLIKVATKRLAKKTLSAAQKRALKKAQAASAAARRKSGYNKTVYRLQDVKGRGPLKRGITPPKEISTAMNKPFPVKPQHAKNISALKKSTGMDFEVLDFNKKSKFGFANKAQANKYFTKKEQNWYASKGFKLSTVKNVKVTGQTKNQLVFKEMSKKEQRAIEKQLERKYKIKL